MQQYPHMGLAAERRDSGLDSNGSTTFQSHSINHALGHIPQYTRQHPGDANYRISPSPSSAAQQQQQSLTFSVSGHSPSQKRKHVDPVMSGHNNKRRREPDDNQDSFDEGAGQGAKHWTDEEKSKLFKWLMGPGHDDHWNSLRATKNSCLRECASEVFGGKKTYQALKGCYERNFNLFKQIYSFESFHTTQGTMPMNSNLSEADSLREYERRLQTARKGGCDVGNITARTIDHWHRNGWYELFYKRWHGDPATTRPTLNHRGVPSHPNGAADDPEGDDDQNMDFAEPMGIPHNNQSAPPPPPPAHEHSSMPVTYVNPQSIQGIPPPISPTTTSLGIHHHQQPPPPPPAPPSAMSVPPSSMPLTSMSTAAPSPAVSSATTSTLASSATLTSTVMPPPLSSSTPVSAAIPPPSASSSSSSDQAVVNVTLTQGMITSYLHFLQVQTQTGKMKMEYLRKREEREERESAQRRELERVKLEREKAEFEHQKQFSNYKAKTERAIELLSNPAIEGNVKLAASEFLKRMFSTD